MRMQSCSIVAGACTQAFRASVLTSQTQVTLPITRLLSTCNRHHLNRNITTVSKSTSPTSLAQQSWKSEDYEYIHESSFDRVHIPEVPSASMVFQENHKWAHKVAIECGLTGRNYTYGQLQDMTYRWGGFIQKSFGKDSNPTIAILSPNTPEYPIVYMGTIAAGAIITTINAAYTPAEIAYHLSDSGASMLVVESVMEPLAEAALDILQKDIPILVNGSSTKGRPNIQDIVKDTNIPYASDIEYDPDRIACLPYSSGTTGLPKGVRISHSAFNAGTSIYHYPEGVNVAKAEGNHQEILMGLLPFFHIYGMSVFISSGLSRGVKVVTLPKFDPKTYVQTLKKNKMSVLHTVPPLMQFLVASPAVIKEDLTTVHTVMCGAAPVPLVAAMALKDKAQNDFCFQEGFGMTETLCTHMTPKDGEKLGCCGKLVPYASAKLLDLETGASVPPGARGELCIKAPTLMSGYHNKPEATKETIDEEGWLHTGDVAICDEEGYFSIVDRIKELIKVKGLQVAPSELEEVILGHPGVADVGVIGVKDERWGEVPRAYIIPKQKSLSEKDIHTFLDDKVARHKKLAGGVRFVQELPKNATGKLLRRQLRALVEEETVQG